MKLKLNEDYDARTRLNEYYPIIRDNLHAVEDCINIHSDELQTAAEIMEKHKTSETLDHPDGAVTKMKLSEEVRGMIDGAGSHGKDKNNPHGVTKEQVGLGNVDNVKQASKTEFDALAETTDGLDGRISDVEEECANAEKALDEIIAIQKQLISNGGLSTGASAGDMYKFVYDTDNDGTVDKAECDAEGNDIVETYATKTNLDALKTEMKNKYMAAEMYDADGDGIADKAKCDVDGNNIAETYVTKAQAEAFAVKEHKHSAEDISSGILSVSHGGTGADTPEGARESLGAAAKDDVGWVSLGEATYADSFSASTNKTKTTIFTLPPENEIIKEFSLFRIIMKAGSTMTGELDLYNLYIYTSGGSHVYKYFWTRDDSGNVLDCDRVVGIMTLNIQGDAIIYPPNKLTMTSAGDVTYSVTFEIQGRK